MNVGEFLQQIALGELSGSNLVDVNSYEIETRHLPKVLHFLNQGLEYFYSNFPLRTNEVVLKVMGGINRYYLDSDYAISTDSYDGVKYIMDTMDNPFRDDVLHITEVSSLDGMTYTLNDPHSYININTPESNCIQLDTVVLPEYLLVKYRASHPKIRLTEPRDSRVKILIPSSYRTALQTYVACLVYNSMGGKHIEVSNALFAKFKSLTEELKLSGIGLVTQTGINIKPQLRGWI